MVVQLPRGQMPKSPDNGDDRGWAQALIGRLPQGAHAEQIAEAVVAVWRDIDKALSPVFGSLGVAALYNRSLEITRTEFPWLVSAHNGALAAMDLTALQRLLQQQNATDAGAAGSAMFQAFWQLLASLVGASLTDRLLGSVGPHSTAETPVQDTPS